MEERERERGSDRSEEPRTGVLVVGIGLLVAVGAPIAYVLWGAVNHLLSGDVGSVRWGLVVFTLLVLALYLYGLSRLVRRWGGEGA